MECRNCKAPVSSGATDCAACGAVIFTHCRNCAARLAADANFCHRCGEPVDAAPKVTPADSAANETGSDSTVPGELGLSHAEADERRQVTILFCDLVESTIMANALEAGVLAKVYKAFYDRVEKIVGDNGELKNRVGDSVDVWFGYPLAREDSAQQAIRAALDIAEKMPLTEVPLEARAHVEKLRVRIGIDTGVIAISEYVGSDGKRHLIPAGNTLNLASRLLQVAEPGTVIVSPGTRRLVGSRFDYLDLGERQLKGFSFPVRAWQALREREVDDPLELRRHALELTPLKGRERELDALLKRWDIARTGTCQIATIRSDPGMGKSRLVQALCERTQPDGRALLQYFCVKRLVNSALHPIIRQLERAASLSRSDSAADMLSDLEKWFVQTGMSDNALQSIPYFAALLSIPTEGRYPPIDVAADRQKERTLQELETMLAKIASRSPVLIVCEDYQWADPSTAEMIERMFDSLANLPIFILITMRSSRDIVLRSHPRIVNIELQPLGQGDALSIVAHLTRGKELPQMTRKDILEMGSGIPLHIEEMTRAELESGRLEERADRYVMAGPETGKREVPLTLRDLLMERLDRLPGTRKIIEAGAVIGREFQLNVLAALVPKLDRARLLTELKRLIEAGLIFRRGSGPTESFVFRHALIQELAYDSIGGSEKRNLHRSVATELEGRFPEFVEGQPELLAYHYKEAGMASRSMEYYKTAAFRARTRSANKEARNHCRAALALLHSEPDPSKRKREELELLTMLGPVLSALEGYSAPEVEEVYARAGALYREIVGEASGNDARAVRGKFQVALLQARYSSKGPNEPGAEKLIEEFSTLVAEAPYNAAYRADARLGRGVLDLFIGNLQAAKAGLDQSFGSLDADMMKRYALEKNLDVESARLAYKARTIWILGFPDQALALAEQALKHAQKCSIALSISQALGIIAMVHQSRGDVAAAGQYADKTIEHSRRHALPYWVALANIVKGWVLAQKGRTDAGIDLICGSIDAFRSRKANLGFSSFLVFLAEAYQRAEKYDEALLAIDAALSHVTDTGERYFEAEAHRRKGELLLAGFRSSRPKDAEDCFGRALDVAREQQAWGWGLRAATSLARHQRDQGDAAAGYTLLQAHRERISEGADTLDVQTADALLHELASARTGKGSQFTG